MTQISYNDYYKTTYKYIIRYLNYNIINNFKNKKAIKYNTAIRMSSSYFIYLWNEVISLLSLLKKFFIIFVVVCCNTLLL